MNIDDENMIQAQADIIKRKKKLGPKSQIIIVSCGQADAKDNDNMQ